MHKIINPGYVKPKTKPIYEATCGCGCKFEFDDEEVTKRTRNLHIPNTIWVECPCCGKELKIDNPKVVREEIIKKFDNKPEDIVDKINDIYTLGKIMLMYADTPIYSTSPDDSEISLHVTIKDYNKRHWDYIKFLIKIFSNDALYRKELLNFLTQNEKNAEELVKN